MVITAKMSDGSERLISCSDIAAREGSERIEIDLCQNGKPFETIVIPDDCEVAFVLSDAKGSKGEKVKTYSLRRQAVAA